MLMDQVVATAGLMNASRMPVISQLELADVVNEYPRPEVEVITALLALKPVAPSSVLSRTVTLPLMMPSSRHAIACGNGRNLLHEGLIPIPVAQYRLAQSRIPIEMMCHG